MITKNQVKLINSLHQKKYRREERLFIAEGEKVVKDLLRSTYDVVTLYGTDVFFNSLGNDIRIAKSTDVVLTTDTELKKISALTTPQKVLAIVRLPDAGEEVDYEKGLKLVMDNISDPGNLGTVLRIADWFGIEEIICSEETVDCYNPKVVQGSMGSVFNVRVSYGDLKTVFEKNTKSYKLPVYGMLLEGSNSYVEKYVDNAFIVLGSEASGIRPDLESYLTHRISIPAFNTRADSLNVAVATGIICYEFRRLKK